MANDRTATYKGKTYKLLFLGKTKFGNKAKLSFLDESKEFWVDSSLITTDTVRSIPSTTRASHRTRTGCSCGSIEEYSQDSDCWTCKHDS